MRLGQALADLATIGNLARRGLEQADLVATPLQKTLNSRIAIEQAKGVLAERHGISVDEAFTALPRHAREDNLRMSDLVRGVADGSPLPPTGGPAPTTSSARRPGSELPAAC